MKQTIRIIGGQFRGKKLHFPSVEGLRPTPDRVRETLFNWLMHDIRDALCLDAFAGSGALGFEAYSRGAAQVLLLEQNPSAYQHLQKQVTLFNSPKLNVRNVDTCKFLEQTKEQFDIVFLDPPFASNYHSVCINRLAHAPLLKTGGLLYIESSQEIAMEESIWQQLKSNRAGQIVYSLYMKR